MSSGIVEKIVSPSKFKKLFVCVIRLNNSSNKDKDLGVRVSRLKNELTRKLDELSPKTPQGESVHALASGAYAGESKLRNAVS